MLFPLLFVPPSESRLETKYRGAGGCAKTRAAPQNAIKMIRNRIHAFQPRCPVDRVRYGAGPWAEAIAAEGEWESLICFCVLMIFPPLIVKLSLLDNS